MALSVVTAVPSGRAV